MTVAEAFVCTCAMGAVILFCRAFPFVFFSNEKLLQSKKTTAFLDFVERIVPPAAMTVLAFNSLGNSLIKPGEFSAAAIIAAVLTVVVHLLRHNSLISILGGTAAYMILMRLL